MIRLGIIDNDEKARSNIIEILKSNDVDRANIPVEILFETDRSSLAVDFKLLSPDIVILDIEHQDVMAVEKLKQLFPKTEIIILTHLSDVKTVRKSFRNGAVSYLLKQTCMEYLNYAVMTTLSQGSYISPVINRALINQAFISKKYEDLLTVRELQIANGIMEGLSYKMIAEQYKISLDTVRIYIKRVYRKLNINSKGELIAQLSL